MYVINYRFEFLLKIWTNLSQWYFFIDFQPWHTIAKDIVERVKQMPLSISPEQHIIDTQ